jgi:hypothetical protein
MLRITVNAQTSASPEQVIGLAGTDFSSHRAKVWSNVSQKRLEVHERSDTYAEVTESATGIAWFAWERSRYDWSHPGRIQQTVIDSNVLVPDSSWELHVTPRDGGGSEVEMTLERHFRRSPAGGLAHALNHLLGRRGWHWYLRSALNAVERESLPAARQDDGRAPAGVPRTES